MIDFLGRGYLFFISEKGLSGNERGKEEKGKRKSRLVILFFRVYS